MAMDSASEEAAQSRRAEVRGSEAGSLDHQLWEVWSKTATEFPDRDAVVSMWQPARVLGRFGHDVPASVERPEHLRWSYKELHSEASRIANWLRYLGCGPGMKIVAVLWNSAEWPLFFWSATKLGMVFVPIDPGAAADLPCLISRLNAEILVVQDEAIATTMSDMRLTSIILKIQCSGPKVGSWLSIGDSSSSGLALGQNLHSQPQSLEYHRSPNRIAMMVLTSGTTGDPKICQHTHRNLMSQTCAYDPNPEDSVERWLVHTPVCHIFAINNALRAWREGGAVVFAAKSFDAGSTLEALIQEKCTIMSATPTLIKSLLSHQRFPRRADIHLDLVTIGGTAITEEDIQLCRRELGAKHAIQAYGMTEGAPLISWKRLDSHLRNGYHPGVGRVLPGTAARVCRPGGRETLKTGELGELHVAGSSIISGYYGETNDSSSFYMEGDVQWFMTGDQATIDEGGIIYLMGRYKDTIIRGGENIQPAKIERLLANLDGIQVAVVGVPDSLAGQIPVAIVKLPTGVGKSVLTESVMVLGPKFALAGIYTLEELGLNTFPLTTLGKIRRGLLTKVVNRHRQNLSKLAISDLRKDEHENLVVSLIDAWEQVAVTRPERDQDVLFLADSISMLRFGDRVVRLCGKHIYLQDLIRHNTVEKQARFLQSDDQGISGVASPHGEPTPRISSKGPMLESHSSAVLRSSIEPSGSFVSQSQRSLESPGPFEASIEAVIPIRSSLRRFVSGQRPQSYQIAFTFRVPGVSRQQIRRAVSQLVSHHPLLRGTLSQRGDEMLHIIPAYTDGLMEHIIFYDEVGTCQEALNYAGNIGGAANRSPFMLNVAILHNKEDGVNYISLTFNHSIMDAISVIPWTRNLDLLLNDSTTRLPELTQYAHFAELHEQYSECHAAKAAVAFHVKRLRGISLLQRALWPVQRAPGWLICDDSGSEVKAERDSSREKVWHGNWENVKAQFEVPRLSRVVHLPTLTLLEKQFEVAPSTFAKASITLFNILQTGCPHAIFTSWESNRTWPFLPKWIEERLPPAMSIDGPTLDWVLNMTEVDIHQSVGGFLKRMGRDHLDMVKHQHAPWKDIEIALQEEGAIALEASFRQAFVWDVSLLGMVVPQTDLTDFNVLEPVNRHNWADCGLFWNAFTIDPQTMYFIASWDTAQMNDLEVQGYCDMLADVMRKLAMEENWSRQIREVFTIWSPLK
ncbi:hypothetical protein NLU13_4342 [Sarocladium strictum]|uniref:AMP-dependent synthetase/ligase domain-containing protein n=1 Tax=Sarocladium strictum TaxID=5046 RepID=A0AA39L8K0_SARSR|nr:hypothetical protein NLU13_4342 [Sarocladium strictum]